MASNGYILDIDTKFIQNLERADKALRQSVESANSLTDRFTQMVNSTSNYSLGVQNVLNVLNQLKGVKIDPATGLLKMGTEARSTAEGIELLKARTVDLKERWVSLSKEIGKKKKGPAAMQIVNEKDLTNINALQTAIANINDILSNASGNKKIGQKTQQQLIEQRKLYSDLLREAQLTDAQRLESEIKLTNGVIVEANKRTEAVIREKKREVDEAIKLARTADVRNSSQVFNARSAIASARQGLDPNIIAEQAQIQALDMALERLNKRYKDVQQTKAETQKDIFAEAKTAKDLARTAQGYDQIMRAMKAINEVVPKINPDTKKGQAEIQSLDRELEKIQKRLMDLANSQPRNALKFASTASAPNELLQAKTYLENALNSGVTGPATIRALNNELDNVKRKLEEIRQMSDAGDAKKSDAKIKEQVDYALALSRTAKTVDEVNRAQAELGKAMSMVDESTKKGTVQMQTLQRAMENLSKTQKDAFADARMARNLASTAKTADELSRAYAELSRAKMNINPDTKRGQEELQRLEAKLKAVQERMDNLSRSTPSGALTFAHYAETPDQLKQAQGYLKNAMGGTSDVEVIRQLNDAWNNVVAKLKEYRAISETGDKGKAAKEAEEQYKKAMAMAQTARSADELKTAIAAIEAAQRGFNDSTGAGAQRLATLENTHRRLTDALARENGTLTETQRKSVDNAVAYAQNAQGALQLTIAYAQLKAAAKGINPKTDEGREALKRLEKELKNLEGKMKNAGVATDRFNQKLSAIGSHIKTAFNFNAIKNFVSKLVKVHGEFEKINKSLEVLIGNSAQAKMLWNSITELALKSPFTVQQLATATKQLAAYRVESSKLYATTKMLADISAGLGVEMNRLILAYGQVKAANFLRGTELRQFSEAGIDMLGQLAAYYSDIEERSVRVGEVFERISNRMVSFQDVDAVLKRVTAAGGAFYQMQEEQSKTLSGKLSNLKDEFQLMLHDIGTAQHGLLVKVIDITRSLLKNWRKWLPILAAITSAFIAVKTAGLAIAVLTPIFNAVTTALSLFKTMSIGAAMAQLALKAVANPAVALATLAAVTAAIWGFTTMMQSADSATDSFNESQSDLQDVYKEDLDLLQRNGALIVSLTKKINELREANEEGLGGHDLETLMERRGAAVAELAKRYKELAGNIGEVFEDEEKLQELFSNETKEQTLATALTGIITGAPKNVNMEEVKAGIDVIYETAARNGEVAPIIWEHVKKAHDDAIQAIYDQYGLTEEILNKSHKEWTAKERAAWESVQAQLAANMEEYGRDVKMTNNLDILYDYYDGLSSQMAYAVEVIRGFMENNPGLLSITDITGMINKIFEHHNLTDEIKDFYKTAFEFSAKTKWIDPPVELEPWHNRYNQWLDTIAVEAGITYEQMKKLDYALAKVVSPDTLTGTVVDQLKAAKKRSEDIIAAWNSFSIAQKESKVIRYTEEDFNNANLVVEYVDKALSFFGNIPAGGGGSAPKNLLQEPIRAINELHKSYKDLQKTFNDSTAKTGAWDKYGKALEDALNAAGINVASFKKKVGDLTSEESVVAAFDELKKYAKDAKERAAVELAKGEFVWEWNVEVDTKAFNEAKANVEKLIDGYELGVELDNLHIPHDFAQNFFDIGITELPELRLQIMAEYEGLNIGKEEQAEIENTLKKIDELEAKAQQERLRKYVEFTRDAISERGKILLEEAYTLADIDSAFTLTDTLAKNKGLITEDQLKTLRTAKKTVDDLLSMDLESIKELFTANGVVTISDKQIENLMKYGELLAEQRLLAIKHSEEQTKQEISELDWSLFKESEVFAQVFNDLENASDSLITTALEKLKEFKSVWADMDVEEFSEVLSMIDKLEAELALATPGEALKNAQSGLKDAMNGKGDYKIEFSKNNKAADDFSPGSSIRPDDYNAYREALEVELALREDIVNTKANDLAIAEKAYNLTIQDAKATDDQKKAAKKAVDDAKDALKTAKDNRDQVASTLSLDQQRRDALEGIRGRMEKSVELANDLYDAFRGLAAAFFEEDSIGMVFADMGMQMMNTVMNTIMLQIQLQSATAGAMAFGTALNSAMGIIGWIVMGIQLLTMALTAAFKAHDKSLQNSIDDEMKRLDVLKDKYEELERALEKAYSADKIGQTTRDMRENLESQKKSIEEMYNLEADKKKSDEKQLEDYQNQMEEIDEQLKEIFEEAFSSLTNGVFDDIISASRDFVNAWHDAFQETGDGVKGLKETFKDMILDVIRQQASLNVMGKYVDMYKGWMNEYVDPEHGDDILTPDEAAEFADRVAETMPQVNDELEGYLGAMQGVLDSIDYGELSGLEKGIQGITEDQAEVLASYWNSCRFLIASIDTTLADLATNVLGGQDSKNSIISELKRQTTILGDIKGLLGSVIASGGQSDHGGLHYIRVFDA